MLFRFTLFVLTLLMIQSINVNNLQASNLILKDAKELEIQGNFHLLLYGSRHGNDIETIAFLDNSEDDYEIELYTPEFNYKKLKSLDTKEAIDRAKKFVSWHSSFMNFSISKIITNDGHLIGYEIKPLYFPFEYGVTDVFDNSYWIRGKKAVISIKLLQSVERIIYDFGNSKEAN
ncbi:MAG: hypothetical protein N2738_04090 [Thermodesulfovibrionales bacterium]|nr:hypothetical protein [Thermodesulfovibrionales bacterium]